MFSKVLEDTFIVKSSGFKEDLNREIYIQGEGDGTAFVVVNRLWAWCFFFVL